MRREGRAFQLEGTAKAKAGRYKKETRGRNGGLLLATVSVKV